MNTILKPIYLLIGTALLLPACTHDEDIPGGIDGQDRRIVFSTSLPGITSRGAAIKDLPYFFVAAFDPEDSRNIRNGVLNPNFDEKIIVDGAETCTSDKCIWPDPGMESHKVTFFAYYPESEKLVTPTNNSTATAFDYKLLDVVVKQDIAEHNDFVTASTTGSMEDNFFSGIALNFNHQFAGIEVKAKSAHKSCDIEIAGVRIGLINKKGTFTFSTDASSGGSWSNITDKTGIIEYIYREGDHIVSLKKGGCINIRRCRLHHG